MASSKIPIQYFEEDITVTPSSGVTLTTCKAKRCGNIVSIYIYGNKGSTVNFASIPSEFAPQADVPASGYNASSGAIARGYVSAMSLLGIDTSGNFRYSVTWCI